MNSVVQYQNTNFQGLPDSMQSSEQSVITYRNLLYTVLRHRWLVLGIFIFIFAGILGFTLASTPIYQASTSIRIDNKSNPVRDFDFLAGGISSSELSTEMEVLKSRSLANDVADSLKLQVSLAKPTKISRDSLITNIITSPLAPKAEYSLIRQQDGRFKVARLKPDSVLGYIIPGEKVNVDSVSFTLLPLANEYSEIRITTRPLRSAADELLSALTIARPARDANVVWLRYENSDPYLARDVANTLAQRFIARRSVVQKTEARSTTTFLRKQLDTLSEQLAATERELQKFRETQKVVNLEAEGTSQVAQLARLQEQRNDIEARRSSLTRLLNEVKKDAANSKVTDPSPYRKVLAFPDLLANQTSALFLESLLKLEDTRSDLLTRRTVNDPDVQSLTSRIRDLENQINSFAATYLVGLNSQAASLDTVLQKFNAQLQEIPAREVEFARLERRPKVLEEIFTTLQARLKEAEIAQAVEDPSVRIIDEAILPLFPITPKIHLNIAIAIIMGIVVGIAAAVLRDMMDQTVHTREHLQRIVGLPVLGLIPRIRQNGDGKYRRIANIYGRLVNNNDKKSLPAYSAQRNSVAPIRFESRVIAVNDPLNPVSEAYRGMRTNITFARPDQVIKTLAFTSPMPGDGKTTTTANLAITLAQQGLRVILIDADLRRGTLNGVFGLPRDPGLSEVIIGSQSFESVIHHIPLNEHVTLDFLSTGPFPPNPAELLGSQRMRDLLEHLESIYDMVIFDTPPVNLVTDAAILGTLVDGILLVSRASVTHQGAVKFAVEQLNNVRAPLLGTVLNDVDFERDVRYYSYNYGYAYQQYYTSTNEG
jgi:tyrosine-protein kinase Etk/Wzc